MSEIWNLSTICRCCHSDGNFKNLSEVDDTQSGRETYETMLQELFSITILQIKTSFFDASYTICQQCIERLKDAYSFKIQVLECEKKFHVYCKNEQYLTTAEITVKCEPSDNHEMYEDNYCNIDYSDDLEKEEKVNLDISKENVKVEVEVPPMEECPILPAKQENVKIKIKKEKIPNVPTKVKTNKKVPANKKGPPHRLIKISREDKKSTKYVCVECAQEYNKLNLITQHLYDSHKGAISYVCKPCKRPFLKVSSYKLHLAKHKKYSKFCCGKEYFYRASFKEHIKSHNLNSKFICDICQKEYRNRSTMSKHLKRHEMGAQRAVLCELCGWGFNDRTNLEIHTRTVHEQLRPFVCDTCGRCFKTKKSLKLHIGLEHMHGAHKCDVCEKPFRCLKSMNIHKLKHDNIYYCMRCNVSYYDKESYRSHSHIIKSTDKCYECHLCNKRYATGYSLKRHVNLHSGVRNVPCDQCTLTFFDRNQMKRHADRVHDPNSTKVQCLVCKRCVHDIDKHMKAHEKKKFNCEYCDLSYIDKKSLLRHLKNMHMAKIFDCDVCGKLFVTLKSVYRHKASMHKIKNVDKV